MFLRVDQGGFRGSDDDQIPRSENDEGFEPTASDLGPDRVFCVQMPCSLGGDLRGVKGDDVAELCELLD